MKRVLLSILLVSVLAIPASAIAIDTQTTSESANAAKAAKAKRFKVGFGVDFVGGEPVAVTDFRFKNLKMDCDQGKVRLKAKNFPDMPVSNDQFSEDFVDGTGGNYSIDGTFNGAATRVDGTVSANGTFPNNNGGGNFTNCEGSKNYTARD